MLKCVMKTYARVEVKFYVFLICSQSGWLHALVDLLHRRVLGMCWIGGWVNQTAVLTP
jgi:hypothetical protein